MHEQQKSLSSESILIAACCRRACGTQPRAHVARGPRERYCWRGRAALPHSHRPGLVFDDPSCAGCIASLQARFTRMTCISRFAALLNRRYPHTCMCMARFAGLDGLLSSSTFAPTGKAQGFGNGLGETATVLIHSLKTTDPPPNKKECLTSGFYH